MRTAVTLALLLAGCAPFHEAVEGPVRVVIGDVRHLCLAFTGTPARGCVTRHQGRITVYCQAGDVACLAHEIRHVVEPGWQHEP